MLVTPSVANVHDKLWEPTAPVIAQPANAGLNDQFRSPAPGSGSLITTLVSVPGRPLVTVTSNPCAVPADTGPAGFAVFKIDTTGQSTVTDAVEEPPPS